MELKQINKTINFSNQLIVMIKNHFQELLIFLNDFTEIYTKEVEKLPYHINFIDELHANENAHSRIFGKLLQQQEPINKRYEILELFINYIIENNSKLEDFTKIKINKPKITQEEKRIDLWIRDSDYAIIFENKIGWADDQFLQLERYIDTTKENNFREKQIYVLYLPPTYEKKPTKQTWGKYYEQDIYKKRYLNLTYKDDILPWLKKDVLPTIRKNERFLSSSIEQYIDHLEGKFNLRTINNNMNMELQNFIKEKLGINDVEPEIAFKVVSEKRIEMENLLTQFESIQEMLQAELDEKFFSRCYKELKESNLDAIRKIDNFSEFHPRSVGVKFPNKMTIWLGKEEGVDIKIFCQINFDEVSKKVPQKIRQKFEEVLREENIEEDKNGYQVWARIENGENALIYLKDFCEKMTEDLK